MTTHTRHVYLPENTPALNILSTELTVRFAKAHIQDVSGRRVQVAFGGWMLDVVDFRHPFVAGQAAALADSAPEWAKARLRSATHRLELYDSGNAAEAHYAEGIEVWELFAALPGGVGFDPASGDFSPELRAS
jgi:hypothetical protein